MVQYLFRDEFNGPEGSPADPALWVHETGGGGWGNGELQTYTDDPANCSLDGDGHLVIRAIKDRSGWTSARIKTQDSFSHYGNRWAARIRIAPRPGFWPAWWFLGANITQVEWPACGEVDVLENYGGSIFETSVHTPVSGLPESDIYTRSAQRPADGRWHVYRMFWDTEGAGAFVFRLDRDPVPYLTVAPGDMLNWCFDDGVPMFTILNLAVGGTGGGKVEGTGPADMLVDWVRCYQA